MKCWVLSNRILAFPGGPGGFRELREAYRNHFHLSWYLLVPVVTSHSQKTLGGSTFSFVAGIIRNITIRNRDPRRLIFLNFLHRVKELVNSDCRFGFCMNNCIYSQLEWSRILEFGPTITNSQTLVPKKAISYHMSPP